MLRKVLLTSIAAVSLTGCLSMKSYVDPGFDSVKYSDIQSPSNKYAMNVDVEFRRNGERFERAEGELRSHVERTLRASGIVQPEFGGAETTILVIVNNVADLASARAKGFGTGLTFGATGSTVVDAYEIQILLKVNGKELESSYQHALHSTVGNADAPFANVTSTTPADAFGKVVEEAILKFINDMQKQNILVLRTTI